MADNRGLGGRGIAANAERQMRIWAIGLDVRDRVEQEHAVADVTERIHPYLVVSRETGAGGSLLATRVAEEMGWQLLDHDLLHHMAESYHLPEHVLEYVDEHTSNWIYEIFGKWLYDRAVPQTEYVTHLGHVLLTATHHESTVIVGRGARFLLPRERGVAVRVLAPLERRVDRIIKRHALTRREATVLVEKTDEERSEFVQRYFHHDVADPRWYDLVINREFVDIEAAVEMVVSLCRRRFEVSPRRNVPR